MRTPIRNQVVRLGLVQHACTPDPARNLAQAIGLIKQAARQGARVVVTPELFLNRYFPQTEDLRNFDLAQTIPGPITRRLGALAKQWKIYLIAGLFEKRAPGLYHNTAITIDPTGRIVSRYRKMHIPDDPRFYEKYYFAPGDLGWQVCDTGKGKIGTLICWDQWYPEAARLTALAGAQILLYPTAIGWQRREPREVKNQQRNAWMIVQCAHAITNGVFVAAVNRVGVEDDLKFWGGSFVVDPAGVVIAQAPADEECVLLADCDLSHIAQTRHGWPFLRDRRIDAYDGIVQRFGAS